MMRDQIKKNLAMLLELREKIKKEEIKLANNIRAKLKANMESRQDLQKTL